MYHENMVTKVAALNIKYKTATKMKQHGMQLNYTYCKLYDMISYDIALAE